MNFLKKCAHLYDKIEYQPDIEASSGTTTGVGVALARRSDLRSAGNL
jgi:hypothetical protein